MNKMRLDRIQNAQASALQTQLMVHVAAHAAWIERNRTDDEQRTALQALFDWFAGVAPAGEPILGAYLADTPEELWQPLESTARALMSMGERLNPQILDAFFPITNRMDLAELDELEMKARAAVARWEG